MSRRTTNVTAREEAADFYVYLKARVGESRPLSVREASELYKEYLIDREQAHAALDAENYISSSEAAKLAGVSQQTIRNWIRAGMIPEVQVVGRRHDLRIPADFLMRVDLGIGDNPDFADPSAFVRRIRAERSRLSDADYFAMLDREVGEGE